jgi:hypothetical protein
VERRIPNTVVLKQIRRRAGFAGGCTCCAPSLSRMAVISASSCSTRAPSSASLPACDSRALYSYGNIHRVEQIRPHAKEHTFVAFNSASV